MFIERLLKIGELLKKKSFFLFGPRSTGKTFLIREQLADNALVIDLLESETYFRLNAKPSLLESMVLQSDSSYEYVVIDEIQKIPMLLNEVHRLIEKHNIRFLLTGSSARSLKKRGVNLLAGRAWLASLFPLSAYEITDFDLDRYLLYGGLPQVYLGEYPLEELAAYIDVYLKEEIQAEAFVRKLQSFSRFLEVSALTSGTMINFASLSSDIAVPASTVREYYRLLEDTLLGFELPAWQKSVKRKAVSTSKFYFFDIGVKNYLCNISVLNKGTDTYGKNFEHFIAMELRCFLSYQRLQEKLTYWQAKGGQAVDFLVGDMVAIEVKAVENPQIKHLKGLKALKEEGICQVYYLVCQCSHAREEDGIQIIHWSEFLKLLWLRRVV